MTPGFSQSDETADNRTFPSTTSFSRGYTRTSSSDGCSILHCGPQKIKFVNFDHRCRFAKERWVRL